jgi:hypothetical protein
MVLLDGHRDREFHCRRRLSLFVIDRAHLRHRRCTCRWSRRVPPVLPCNCQVHDLFEMLAWQVDILEPPQQGRTQPMFSFYFLLGSRGPRHTRASLSARSVGCSTAPWNAPRAPRVYLCKIRFTERSPRPATRQWVCGRVTVARWVSSTDPRRVSVG